MEHLIICIELELGALPLWACYYRSKRKKTDYHYNQEPKKHTRNIQNSASTETESKIEEKQPSKKTQKPKKATKSTKGQLILKCLFGVFNSSRKRTNTI